MARTLYINPDPTTKDRARVLGCGWMARVPIEFPTAIAPCVILEGAGQTIIITDTPPTTNQAVATALQPILDAEAAFRATEATAGTNRQTLLSRAQAALAANDTYLAIASPTNVQVVAQTRALTKECSALIRLVIDQLDTTSGT